MRDEQIKHMVQRFLSWKLPHPFRPDAGISFEPFFNVEYMAAQGKPPMRHEPTGTNLFDATQAEAMVRHMIDGLPPSGEGRSNGAVSNKYENLRETLENNSGPLSQAARHIAVKLADSGEAQIKTYNLVKDALLIALSRQEEI